MELQRLLVVTGDHQAADSTKWEGGYSEEDLALHHAMVDALVGLGRFDIEVCTDHSQLLSILQERPPQLVFNLCDTGFRNVATQELHVAALYEIFDVPYTGATPAAMVLAYDKSIVSLLAASMGIPSPQELALGPDDPLPSGKVDYPALVKPAQGDGSVGINRGARVQNDEELANQLAWFRETLPGKTALVQEFLPGAEYGLGLVGNPGSFEPLPMLEVDYSTLPSELPPILAFESKTGPANPYDDVGIVPATLPADVVDTLVRRAGALFERIGCRDYARFDFRTAQDGTIKLMEVNPNPAWSRRGKLAKMARFADLEYPRILERLIDTAWQRVSG